MFTHLCVLHIYVQCDSFALTFAIHWLRESAMPAPKPLCLQQEGIELPHQLQRRAQPLICPRGRGLGRHNIPDMRSPKSWIPGQLTYETPMFVWPLDPYQRWQLAIRRHLLTVLLSWFHLASAPLGKLLRHLCRHNKDARSYKAAGPTRAPKLHGDLSLYAPLDL